VTTTAPIDLTDARCLHCGYALRGLSENRCPECGRAFDPADPLTFTSPLFRQRLRLAFWLPALLFCTTFITLFLGPILLPLGLPRLLTPWGRRPFMVIWLIIDFVLAWTLRTRARRAILWPMPEPRPRSERAARWVVWIGMVLVVIAVGGGIQSWTCPHGTSFRLSLIGITHSNAGGPCSNTVQVGRVWRISSEWYVWIAD
jgi:hypothetical protein